MLITTVYVAALTVILIAAIVAALDHDIWIGPVGSALLGGIAVFAVLGYEYRPRQWITGLLACLAMLVVLAYYRWRVYLRMQQEEEAARHCRRVNDVRGEPPA